MLGGVGVVDGRAIGVVSPLLVGVLASGAGAGAGRMRIGVREFLHRGVGTVPRIGTVAVVLDSSAGRQRTYLPRAGHKSSLER